ncbi:hypothetical protein GCM10010277_86920 [Streptomyces longisporoflavus]|nr:hypothetical protein GCM10010277_86920 [Streptomyces longisporoflavus]
MPVTRFRKQILQTTRTLGEELAGESLASPTGIEVTPPNETHSVTLDWPASAGDIKGAYTDATCRFTPRTPPSSGQGPVKAVWRISASRAAQEPSGSRSGS